MSLSLPRYQHIIALHIKIALLIYQINPKVAKLYSLLVDPFFLAIFAIDMTSYTVRVKNLSISHPSGILLGGNGIVSLGEVVISSGVKFVGRSPNDPAYLREHANGSVFRLGSNVFIGANTVLIGPISICDNVVISAASLVNRNIDQPGTYGGIPIKKLKTSVDHSWFCANN